jgi:hypothetical protein
LPADVDIDGVVNYSDFVIFASAWQRAQGEPDYDPVCDFVVDDIIDANDLQVLADNWLRRITIADFTKDGSVNLADFATFSDAWDSIDGRINWNPDCDIADPQGVIDISDLLLFALHWLEGT